MRANEETAADTLGRLLQWARLRGQLDLRCRMHDVFALPHAQAPAGIALFHTVLEGGCRLGLPDGRWYPLLQGEMVVLPRGLAHNLVALQGAIPHDGALDDTRRPLRQQGWLPLRSNASDEACLRDSLDLVCGRFVHQGEAGGLLLQALPDVLILGEPRSAESVPGAHWPGAPIQVVHVPLLWPAAMGGSALHPVLGLVQLLRQETSAEQPGARAMADLLTQALLLHVLRAYAQSEAARQLPGVLNLLAEPRLQAVVQAMWQQPGGDWSLDSLAERAAMSRATFTRHFAQHAGMSPWAFLTQLRMLHGMELLRDPRHSLAQIAELTGYQSESAFSVAFRKYSGQTPARYRREHG
ncbi:AraC family transcriptional regulator [Brachymonas sp. G13]|uniref:AraC family transcriptional regulator n=1 Tax=Brachymonas wangyanguii TaxID=3130163 RepID=UPI00307DBE48